LSGIRSSGPTRQRTIKIRQRAPTAYAPLPLHTPTPSALSHTRSRAGFQSDGSTEMGAQLLHCVTAEAQLKPVRAMGQPHEAGGRERARRRRRRRLAKLRGCTAQPALPPPRLAAHLLRRRDAHAASPAVPPRLGDGGAGLQGRGLRCREGGEVILRSGHSLCGPRSPSCWKSTVRSAGAQEPISPGTNPRASQ